MLPLVLGALVASVFLWPSNAQRHHPAFGVPTDLVKGTVVDVKQDFCQAGVPDAGICSDVSVAVKTGPDAGRTVTMTITEGPGQPRVEKDMGVVVGRTDTQGQITYYFADLERSNGLALLGFAFAVFLVWIARLRGIGALVGLVITFGVITIFVLPSILDGNSPVLVTVTGSTLIIVAVLYIAHGFNARTTTAIIGTLVSLAIVGVGAVFGVNIANVTGMSNEEVSYIQSFATNVNIEGLLLSGIILGGLGVLNDMTVSQASSVWEIHAARPTANRREIYASGMRVGRDHIASTVYTLVLAYTGAALPLLILFTLADRSLGSVLTSDIVGEEIVRSVVGGIGLMASVPITTALAAVVVKTTKQTTTKEVGPTPDGDAESTGADSPSTASPPAAQDTPAAQHLAGGPVESRVHATETPVDQGANSADQSGRQQTAKAPAPVGDNEVKKLDNLLANLPVAEPKKRRGIFKIKRPQPTFFDHRPMSRRERKFWEGT